MSQLDNVNRALAEIGTRSRITVVDDSTTEGLYALLLYPMLRDAMLRMGDYDWSMSDEPAAEVVPSPNDPLWPFAYFYPANCVRIRQVVPVITDPFDPVPVEFNVLASNVGLVSRLVVAKVPLDRIVFSSNLPPEFDWDAQFTDAFIRYLASALTMALENRLEASDAVLKQALTFGGLANQRVG